MKIITRRLFLTSLATIAVLASIQAYSTIKNQFFSKNIHFLKEFLRAKGYFQKIEDYKKINEIKSEKASNLAIISDFETGEIIEIDGWIFSKTEVFMALK